MKLYNKNKNKWKFPFFANFTKKINDNYFSGFALYKNALLSLSSNMLTLSVLCISESFIEIKN